MIPATGLGPVSPRRFALLCVALWAAGLVALVILAVRACDGHLVYTLDDPYIHLALAENIARGHYGVNWGEAASPSSSILWPPLLAAGHALGLGGAAPLVINALAMGAAVALAAGIVLRHVVVAERLDSWDALILVGSLCLAMNAWALVLTGMEHSLHLLAVVVVVRSLLAPRSPGNAALLAGAAILAPLVRFEGLAMTVAVVGVLLVWRRWKLALVIGATTAAVLVGWSVLMHSLGLPLFPSSVLAKSAAAAGVAERGPLVAMWTAVRTAASSVLTNRQPAIVAAAGALLAVQLLKRWRDKGFDEQAALWAVASACAAAHLLFGAYGWLGRYEAYLFCLLALAVLVRCGALLGDRFAVASASVVMVVAANPLAWEIARVPAASANIYLQQFQMHRFAVDYWKAPVAVNDIGLVSWRNGNYVLDLGGLASEEVRALRARGALTAQRVEQLSLAHDVGLAMIYDSTSFEGSRPGGWKRLVRLVTPQVSAAGGEVSFYATQPGAEQRLVPLLRKFESTLPAGARLEWEAS